MCRKKAEVLFYYYLNNRKEFLVHLKEPTLKTVNINFTLHAWGLWLFFVITMVAGFVNCSLIRA